MHRGAEHIVSYPPVKQGARSAELTDQRLLLVLVARERHVVAVVAVNASSLYIYVWSGSACVSYSSSPAAAASGLPYFSFPGAAMR